MPYLQSFLEIIWVLIFLLIGFVSGCVFVVYQAGKNVTRWKRIAK